MKKLLFPCLLVAAIALQAQTVNITLSKEFTLKDPGSSLNETMYKVGDFFYFLELDHKSMQMAFTPKLEKIKYTAIIHKYDLGMKEVAKYAIGNGKELGPFRAHMLVYNSTLLLFYYQMQEAHAIKLFMTTVEPESLQEKNTKELCSLNEKNVTSWDMDNALGSNNFEIWASPDQSKLLLSQSGNSTEVFTCVINENYEVLQPRTATVNKKYTDFRINNGFIDDNGNRYLSYTYTLNKIYKRGVLIQTPGGKETYADFNTGNKLWEANMLSFHMGADNLTVYVYANYYGEYLDEGLLVSTVNAANATFGKVNLYAYPDYMRERLTKMDFGVKQKGTRTIRRVDYVCNDMEDGSMAFSGTPIFSITRTVGNGYPRTTTYVGPIINIFVKEENYNIGIVYRSITAEDPAGFIAMPYKNNLLLIYNDGPKNINIKDTSDYNDVDKPSNLVMAKALVSAKGAVLSKQQVSENPVGSNYFFTTYRQRLDTNKYLIPIGRERANMVRFYTEIVQWATVDIQ